MTEEVTQCTMWKDARGCPWDTEDAATAANASNDLVVFLSNAAQSGAVAGLSDCNLTQLSALLLSSYAMDAPADD